MLGVCTLGTACCAWVRAGALWQPDCADPSSLAPRFQGSQQQPHQFHLHQATAYVPATQPKPLRRSAKNKEPSSSPVNFTCANSGSHAHPAHPTLQPSSLRLADAREPSSSPNGSACAMRALPAQPRPLRRSASSPRLPTSRRCAWRSRCRTSSAGACCGPPLHACVSWLQDTALAAGHACVCVLAALLSLPARGSPDSNVEDWPC